MGKRGEDMSTRHATMETNMNTHETRHRTIASNGQIITAPYGVSRWANPKTYTCAHEGCPNPATVLRTADAHPTEVAKTHNCCGTH